MLDRNELWAQASELAELITRSEEVQAYREAERAMQANPDARVLLRKLRDQQEQLTNLERFASRDLLKGLEEDIQNILDQLDAIPEVKTFRDCQERVNDLLQQVSMILANVITERVEEPSSTPEGENNA